MKHIFLLAFAGILSISFAAGRTLPGRYIVELSGEPSIGAAAAPNQKQGIRAAAVDRRAAVREQHRNMRAAIEQADTEVLNTIENVANALVVKTTAARAAEIAKMPGVRRVHAVKLYKATLDRAVYVQKVTDAWALLGGSSNAGAGIKVGIIDTGIDSTHPAFQDSTLPPLDGFPKVNRDTDVKYTNNKIIVARCYDTAALPSPALDKKGHGTAVSMIVAGVTNGGALGTITGIAPKAYLGNYKVFPDSQSGAPDDEILKALDDAVADGMDVINMSLGSQPAERPENDVLVQAVERATSAGIIVVIAAGNEGPDRNTIGSPGTAPDAITVGNSANDRIFAGKAKVDGAQYALVPGSASNGASAVSGSVVDIATLDQTGLACGALPAGSLTGKIALILRGTCLFEDKINNADHAGAVAALIYTDAARPDVISMSTGAAALSSGMISFQDGSDLKQRIASNTDLNLTLDFSILPFFVSPASLAYSSSRGPSVDGSLKPDVLAVGSTVLTAAPKNGFTVASGTSLSAPMITGAAALLKAARPGLTPQQYRSLLINSAATLDPGATAPLSFQLGGSGLLNMTSALADTVTAFPTSLSLGSGSGTVDLNKSLTITNVASIPDTLTISVVPGSNGPAASVSTTALQLAPGQSGDIAVRFQAPIPAPGEYQGYVVIRSSQSAVETRVPYWYGVPSGTVQAITVLDAPTSGRGGSAQTIYFRMTDASGLPVLNDPKVTSTAGGGTVDLTVSLDSQIPGLFETRVKLGRTPGDNQFLIQSGDKSVVVTISAQ